MTSLTLNMMSMFSPAGSEFRNDSFNGTVFELKNELDLEAGEERGREGEGVGGGREGGSRRERGGEERERGRGRGEGERGGEREEAGEEGRGGQRRGERGGREILTHNGINWGC